MRIQILLSVLFLPVFYGCSPEAPPAVTPDEESVYRPALPADLTGVWKQVELEAHDPVLDISGAWFSGWQFYWFKEPEEDRQFLRIFIQEGEEPVFEEIRESWGDSPWQVYLTWSGDGQAVMTFPEQESEYLVRFTLKDEDLVLTFFTPEGKPHFSRLLERVAPHDAWRTML